MSTVKAPSFAGTGQIVEFIKSRVEPGWMQSLRQKAFERFAAMAWPSAADEEWRRSDISSYNFDSYSYASIPRADLPAGESPEGTSGTLTFSGGECRGATLADDIAQKGVMFTSLSEFMRRSEANHAEDVQQVARNVEAIFEGSISYGDNRLYPWHYSTWTHGALLYVPRNVNIDLPFLVHYHERGDAVLSAPHLVVILESGASARLVERVTGDEEGEVMCNEGVDLLVGDAANLDLTAVHNLNIDSSLFSNGIAHIGRDAHIRHSINLFGGMFSKTRFDANLDGPGAEVTLDGLYFPHEDQHMDLRTVQVHNAPNTNSRAFYKGAVKEEGRSVFQGLIRVEHDASQTDAFLTNNNLILTDGARADSIPSLQINTDDVKCSHGSTTGKLDPLQIFYLESRGYSPEEANSMLVQGFFDEVISRCPPLVQEEMRSMVAERVMDEEDEEDE